MDKGRRTSVILYADYSPELESDRLRLAGLRRYATARKWRVETLEHQNCSPTALREALARLRPIGCAAECWRPRTALKPALFGRVPVVYFSPPDGPDGRARAASAATRPPSIYRITWWNLVDYTYHRESLASGLYAEDMRRKPVYDALYTTRSPTPG